MTHAQFDLGTVEPDVDRTDLSSAFGDSAADSLRGLLAPRRAPVRTVDDPGDEPAPETPTPADPTESADTAETAVAPETPTAPRAPELAVSGPATPSPTTPSREVPSRATPSGEKRDGATPGRQAPGGTVPAPRRRPRPTQVRDRGDVDLLILAVVGDGVADGREIIALVRDRSGGAVELTERWVYNELHRLRHNRLVADRGRGERARFVLTETGQRILHARARRWRAYTRAMGRVLGSEPPTGAP